MATIKKLIQSAPRMRGVTPVPNGPLIKKDGTSLKKGGKVKKAQLGMLMSLMGGKEGGGGPTELRGKLGNALGIPGKPIVKNGKTIKSAKNGAWQRKEGKNPEGGLNAKGRASYNKETGGHLKAPQPEGGPRKCSFCARMSGVKGPMKKPNGKPTRKALALRKWKC